MPPGELSKLHIGMKQSEAKALAPGAVSARNGVPLAVDGVKEYVSIDDRSATVRSIYLNVPPSADEVLKEAWGEPNAATEQLGKPVQVWFDSETGWRATLRNALGVNHDLFFDNYIPADKLLGDQPDTLGGLPSPVLGKTVDEIKKAYKDEIVVVLPNKELVLTLLPTEWEHVGTRIQLNVSGLRVKELSFAIPWKGFPNDKDVLEKLFRSKWGEPKEIEDANGKPVLVFRDDDPRVEVRPDDARGEWLLILK